MQPCHENAPELGGRLTWAELIADFPYLDEQDIREALAYAAGLAQRRDMRPASWCESLADRNLFPGALNGDVAPQRG